MCGSQPRYHCNFFITNHWSTSFHSYFCIICSPVPWWMFKCIKQKVLYNLFWDTFVGTLVECSIIVDSSNTDLNPIPIQALLRSVFDELTIDIATLQIVKNRHVKYILLWPVLPTKISLNRSTSITQTVAQNLRITCNSTTLWFVNYRRKALLICDNTRFVLPYLEIT